MYVTSLIMIEIREYLDNRGGTKKRQQKDIEAAQTLWQEYKRRKKQET